MIIGQVSLLDTHKDDRLITAVVLIINHLHCRGHRARQRHQHQQQWWHTEHDSHRVRQHQSYRHCRSCPQDARGHTWRHPQYT